MTGGNVLFLDWFLLEAKTFKPQSHKATKPQNKVLIPLKSSFQNAKKFKF